MQVDLYHSTRLVDANKSETITFGNLFISRLEPLRGLAALMVAAGHSLMVFPIFFSTSSHASYLLLICNGRAGVTIFFILSGLVLGLSLRRSKGTFWATLTHFCIRRFFRIWPALGVCTIVLVFYYTFLCPDQDCPAASLFFRQLRHTAPTIKEVVMNLIFGSSSLNPPTWTLKVEMICAMLLPLLWLISPKKLVSRKLVIFGMLLSLSLLRSSGSSSHFLYMFYAGYLLPEVGPALMAPLRGNVVRTSIVIFCALVLLLCARLVEGSSSMYWTGVFFEAVGAFVFISGLVYGIELKCYRVLDHPLAKLYGKISYSFYLWHYICMFIIARWFLEFSRLNG